MRGATLIQDRATGRWVARWAVEDIRASYSHPERQRAAWVLFDAVGIWLGLGDAPDPRDSLGTYLGEWAAAQEVAS